MEHPNEDSNKASTFPHPTPNSASLAEILLKLKDNNEATMKKDLMQTPLQRSNSNPETKVRSILLPPSLTPPTFLSILFLIFLLSFSCLVMAFFCVWT